MNLDFTIFADRRGNVAVPQHATLHELASQILKTLKPEKDALPLVKFCTFGEAASMQGCLRHDGNVVSVTGVEGDYDQEKLSFNEAVALAEKARVYALLYTSPSYAPGKPRWRVIAPFSRPAAPGSALSHDGPPKRYLRRRTGGRIIRSLAELLFWSGRWHAGADGADRRGDADRSARWS
jgi:hypothetical protein